MRYDPNLVPMESDFDNGDEEDDVMYKEEKYSNSLVTKGKSNFNKLVSKITEEPTQQTFYDFTTIPVQTNRYGYTYVSGIMAL